MSNPILNKLKFPNWATAALICFGSIICPAAPDGAHLKGVDFQIVTDRLVYRPGSTMKVKFIVANTGESSLYIPRSLSECSNIEGSFFFRILDENDHDLTGKGCSSDVGPTWEIHVTEQIFDPKLWIALEPGEIFGKASTFELPNKNGTYILKAELTPPGFSDKQKEILSQKGMRVLQRPCPAPIVTITVK